MNQAYGIISKNCGGVKAGKDLHDYGVQPCLGSTFALNLISPWGTKQRHAVVSKALIPDAELYKELYKANQANKTNTLVLNKPQCSGNPERAVQYLRIFASELIWRIFICCLLAN